MADTMHRSSDVPDFDTYPGSPPAVTESDRLLQKGQSPLEQRAAELGAAAGRVVRMVKQARSTVENFPNHPVLDRLGALGQEARARAEYLRMVATSRAQDLTQSAKEKTNEIGRRLQNRARYLGNEAKLGYERARARSIVIAHDYPVHVAAAAGAVGFLIGVGLRIRRANRAY